MQTLIPRRALLLAGLLVPLAACESIPGVSLAQAVRQLLTLSTRRALARLGQENGFLADPQARIAPPVILPAGQERLVDAVNRAASAGARAAWPLLRRTIREFDAFEPEAIVRGGPNDATDAFRAFVRENLFEAIAPAIGASLGQADPAIVAQALQAPNLNAEGLRLDIARRTNDAIFAAIGREEAAIRENPGDRAYVFGSRPFVTRLGNGRGPL